MKGDLIYPELSYKIIGIAFKFFRAMALEFDKERINMKKKWGKIPENYQSEISFKFAYNF